jgi:hypothetical protein
VRICADWPGPAAGVSHRSAVCSLPDGQQHLGIGGLRQLLVIAQIVGDAVDLAARIGRRQHLLCAGERILDRWPLPPFRLGRGAVPGGENISSR